MRSQLQAIAVAVMPPLSVVGIGFALKQPEIAFGGALTFLANVVAINLAASLVFWLLNFSPRWSLCTLQQIWWALMPSAGIRSSSFTMRFSSTRSAMGTLVQGQGFVRYRRQCLS